MEPQMISLLAPPLAFVGYAALIGLIFALSGRITRAVRRGANSPEAYSGGEQVRTEAAPGYQQFFRTTLFFALLHLGALMIGLSDLSVGVGLYVLGLMAALMAVAEAQGEEGGEEA
ncbi:MAG: hypothetical protein IAE83_22430 [Anaerolinea sp.]|nr:hypothetical protein [Anaerolinea sp.]